MARIDFRSVGGGASVSYGSNATQVSDANAGGASTTVSRSDHRHLGVASITASSSNTMVDPTVNIRPGNNVSFDVNTSTNTLTINANATAGGGTSYGSNANEVGATSAAGASTSVSRADHVHRGVFEVTSSSSNTMTQRTINLRPGGNVGFGLDIASNTLTISSTGGAAGGASVSYASNSNDVGTADAAGASSLVSRADHVHSGVYEVTASSSNTLTQRTVNLRAGTGIALGVDAGAANQTITITNIAGSTGGGGAIPTTGGGGPIPNIVQFAHDANGDSSSLNVTIAAAAEGNRLIVVACGIYYDPATPTCTNVTFTSVMNIVQGGDHVYLRAWVGVVSGGPSGTTVALTKGGGACFSADVYEVEDALTPTAGTPATSTTGDAWATVGPAYGDSTDIFIYAAASFYGANPFWFMLNSPSFASGTVGSQVLISGIGYCIGGRVVASHSAMEGGGASGIVCVA